MPRQIQLVGTKKGFATRHAGGRGAEPLLKPYFIPVSELFRFYPLEPHISNLVLTCIHSIRMIAFLEVYERVHKRCNFFQFSKPNLEMGHTYVRTYVRMKG